MNSIAKTFILFQICIIQWNIPNLENMEKKFSYNQAVFGLMQLGAKADGKLQDEEKKLLVELTSEEHHLSAEEYKYVINVAKEKKDEEFSTFVYATLNTFTQEEKIKALYWLWKVIKSDDSSNNTPDNLHNTSELNVYMEALKSLSVNDDEVKAYEKLRN